ncbi:TPA: hypothetical protein N0F65_003793 [Lagenidium giganteum]|uniref:Ubiquitin-like domain-containing protein n=1 Tax=Lagenidium giganteum TaxID=4803 RepID=A0AAV2YUL9_9STRA|nr:TPA: hypothetical protein N0F65_003793 [Lagenidium giganteum]
MRVVVVQGKTTLSVEYEATSGTGAVMAIKNAIEKALGIAVEHQKLLYRGKELKSGVEVELHQDAKLMLLLTAAYHKTQKNNPSAKATITTTAADATAADVRSDSSIKAASEAAPTTVLTSVDVEALEDTQVLVEVARGKAKYQFVCEATDTVGSVKMRLSGVTGMASAAIRLLMQGKTPTDESTLGAMAKARVVKAMMLLQEKQHVLMEHEEELRGLLNELAQLQVRQQKLQKQVSKNVLAREEASAQLALLADRVGCLQSNLEHIQDQIRQIVAKRSTVGEGGGVSANPTLVAIENALSTCRALSEATAAMMQHAKVY